MTENITVNNFYNITETGLADVKLILQYLRDEYDSNYFKNINIMDAERDIINEFFECLKSSYDYRTSPINNESLIKLYNDMKGL